MSHTHERACLHNRATSHPMSCQLVTHDSLNRAIRWHTCSQHFVPQRSLPSQVPPNRDRTCWRTKLFGRSCLHDAIFVQVSTSEPNSVTASFVLVVNSEQTCVSAVFLFFEEFGDEGVAGSRLRSSCNQKRDTRSDSSVHGASS